jgi:hypothetical protein
MTNQIDDSIKRTMAFWYADGVAELCMGVVFLLLGAVLLVEGPAPRGSTLAAVMPALRYLVIIGGTIGIGVALRYLKLNVTYPRSGFVFYNKPPVKEMIPGIFGAVSLTLMLDQWIQVGMPEKLSWYIWLMAGLTIFFGYLFIAIARQTGFRRIQALAAITIISGMLLGGTGWVAALNDSIRSMLLGPGLFFIAIGTACSVSGAATFRGFMHQTRSGELA